MASDPRIAALIEDFCNVTLSSPGRVFEQAVAMCVDLPKKIDDWPGPAKGAYFSLLKELNAYDRERGLPMVFNAIDAEVAIREVWK